MVIRIGDDIWVRMGSMAVNMGGRVGDQARRLS